MIRQPPVKIAVFNKQPTTEPILSRLYQSVHASLYEFTNLEQVINDLYSSEQLFDIIVFLCTNLDVLSAQNLADEINRHEVLTSIPLIALTDNNLTSSLFENSLFDAIFSIEENDGKLSLIINALCNRKRIFDKQFNKIASNFKTNDLLEANFQFSPIAQLVFNERNKLLAINKKATQLLKITTDKEDEPEATRIISSFLNHIKSGKNIVPSSINSHGFEFNSELTISRQDGLGLRLTVRICPLSFQNVMVYFVNLQSADTLIETRQLLNQQLRERSIFISCASTHHKTFNTPGLLVSNYEKSNLEASNTSKLDIVVNKVVELLDAIIDTQIEVKLDLSEDTSIPADLSKIFRLLSSLFLISADFLAGQGSIELSDSEKSKLIIKASSPKSIGNFENSENINRDLHPVANFAFEKNFTYAISIAEEFNFKLNYTIPEPNILQFELLWGN